MKGERQHSARTTCANPYCTVQVVGGQAGPQNDVLHYMRGGGRGGLGLAAEWVLERAAFGDG